MKVRPAIEALMYLAFCAAALPMARLGLGELVHYRAHPEMLQERDSAPLVMSVTAAAGFIKIGLAVALPLAVYFLVTGPAPARVSSAVLISAWLSSFVLAMVIDAPSFSSTARLYWDAVPFVALAALPWLCAGLRVTMRSRGAPGGQR